MKSDFWQQFSSSTSCNGLNNFGPFLLFDDFEGQWELAEIMEIIVICEFCSVGKIVKAQ